MLELDCSDQNCSKIGNFPPEMVLINGIVNLKFLQTSSEILNKCRAPVHPANTQVWVLLMDRFPLLLYLCVPLVLESLLLLLLTNEFPEDFLECFQSSSPSAAFLCCRLFSCCLGRVQTVLPQHCPAEVSTDPLKSLLQNTPFLPESSLLLNSCRNPISWSLSEPWFGSAQCSFLPVQIPD